MSGSLDTRPLFFYGSLRDRDLLRLVLGRETLDGLALLSASLKDVRVGRVEGESFPMIAPEPGAIAPGLLVAGLDARDRARLGFFEDSDYRLAPAKAVLDGGETRAAALYLPTEKLRLSDQPWNLEDWRRDGKALLMECAREQMSYFGRAPQAIVETWWPEIKARAQARLGLRPSPRSLRGRADVEERRRETLAEGRRYSVEAIALRHARFGGGLGEEIERVVVRIPPAATLLPYDPRRDELVLVEQWRAGPWIAGDDNPWSLEMIAGGMDDGETPEAAARREAMEEAGLEIGRTEFIGRHFVSPGMSDQVMHAFIGEAALAHAGGVHGKAEEQEDIRVLRLGFFEAMTALARGDIDNAPTALSLLWLARNRERLRLDWEDE